MAVGYFLWEIIIKNEKKYIIFKRDKRIKKVYLNRIESEIKSTTGVFI